MSLWSHSCRSSGSVSIKRAYDFALLLLGTFYVIYYFLLLISAINVGSDAASNFSQGVQIFFLLYGFILAFFSVNSLLINSKVGCE
jgi:hypothetical protein